MRDFDSWRSARLQHEARLAPAFGETSRSWGELNSSPAWIEKYTIDRRLARTGQGHPRLLTETFQDRTSRIAGEVSICGVDELSNAGELSAWSTAESSVLTWALHRVVLDAFECSHALDWIVAPVAVTNPRPGRALTLAGFEKSATLRQLRMYDGRPTDHDLWICENTPASRTHLRETMKMS